MDKSNDLTTNIQFLDTISKGIASADLSDSFNKDGSPTFSPTITVKTMKKKDFA